MRLSSAELRVVRAALVLAVHGEYKAWDALSYDDEGLARNLLDLIPEPMVRCEDDPVEEDPDDDY